jgi:hypothetical protein
MRPQPLPSWCLSIKASELVVCTSPNSDALVRLKGLVKTSGASDCLPRFDRVPRSLPRRPLAWEWVLSSLHLPFFASDNVGASLVFAFQWTPNVFVLTTHQGRALDLSLCSNKADASETRAGKPASLWGRHPPCPSSRASPCDNVGSSIDVSSSTGSEDSAHRVVHLHTRLHVRLCALSALCVHARLNSSCNRARPAAKSPWPKAHAAQSSAISVLLM